jgi:hypothetical protein
VSSEQSNRVPLSTHGVVEVSAPAKLEPVGAIAFLVDHHRAVQEDEPLRQPPQLSGRAFGELEPIVLTLNSEAMPRDGIGHPTVVVFRAGLAGRPPPSRPHPDRGPTKRGKPCWFMRAPHPAHPAILDFIARFVGSTS